MTYEPFRSGRYVAGERVVVAVPRIGKPCIRMEAWRCNDVMPLSEEFNRAIHELKVLLVIGDAHAVW
jgi:hypothetical protein